MIVQDKHESIVYSCDLGFAEQLVLTIRALYFVEDYITQ